MKVLVVFKDGCRITGELGWWDGRLVEIDGVVYEGPLFMETI